MGTDGIGCDTGRVRFLEEGKVERKSVWANRMQTKVHSPLTAISQHECGQGRECLICGNVETTIIERLYFVVLYVEPTAILPVLDGQRKAIWIVLGRPHQERAPRILFGQQQLIGFLARHILEVPTAEDQTDAAKVRIEFIVNL